MRGLAFSILRASLTVIVAGVFFRGMLHRSRRDISHPTRSAAVILISDQDDAAQALRAMKESAHALQQVHVVFRLVVATDMEKSTAAGPKDSDGLSQIQDRFLEGDVGADGRYHLRCGESGENPKWDGTKLIDWPQSQQVSVSDGEDMMVYHTGNQSAFTGKVKAHGQSQLQDVVQDTQMIRDWLSNPNLLDNFDKLVVAPSRGSDTGIQCFDQPAGSDTVINLECDPTKSFLSRRRTFRYHGDVLGDTRATDFFEVAPSVWRARNVVDCNLITKRFILSVQKDAKDPKDHMVHRSTLKILQAAALPLNTSSFEPLVPREAQWIYAVQEDGKNVPVKQPPGVPGTVGN